MAFTKDTQKLWDQIVDEYEFGPAELSILRVALDARDEYLEAKRKVEEEGSVYRDRFGQLKPHPSVRILHDARREFLHGMRALRLNLSNLE